MRQMHLIMVTAAGPTSSTWKHPADQKRFLDPDFWDAYARILEDAKFDAIFFADSPVFSNDAAIEYGGELYLMDPLPLIMSIARATKHLGVAATVSTTFTDPYSIARRLGTIDVLSGGRVAWNVVTFGNTTAAQRFGLTEMPDQATRYDRADEMLEACFELWDSFGPDAIVNDKNSGIFIDRLKLKSFDYDGNFIHTKGPLSTPQSPQGRPVIFQAGASDRGRQFAARWADAIFSLDNDVERMRAYYDDIKHRVAAGGRSPDSCKILTTVTVTVAETEAIAREKRHYLNEVVTDEMALSLCSSHCRMDFSSLPLDRPLPYLPEMMGTSTPYSRMLEVGAVEGLNVLQIARRYVCNGLGPEITGSAEQVADVLQSMFDQRVCDGFALPDLAAVAPGTVEDFTRLVVPVLQERNLFRREYPGTTLRSSLEN